MSCKSKKKLKISITLSVLAVLVTMIVIFCGKDIVDITTGLWNGSITQDGLKEIMSSFGLKGVIILIVLSFLQLVLTILPAEPIQVIAGMSYGIWNGVLICLAGVIIGNAVMYLVYKLFGKKLSTYIQGNVEVDIDSIQESNKISLIVLVLYLLPAIPYGIICLLTAMMGVKFGKYMILTTIGAIPSIMIGVSIGRLAIHASLYWSMAILAVLVVLLIIIFVKRKAIFALVNKYIEGTKYTHHDKFVVQKPENWLYKTIIRVSKIITVGKVKLVVKGEMPKIERPSILLCNHASFYDFAYVLMTMKKYKLNFVMARMYFYNKSMRKWFQKYGCFPKSMFSIDIECIKNCYRVINSGGTIAMFPEARLPADGKYEDIQPSTFKLIKKLGVDVYTLKSEGSFLAKPKWGNGIRKGSVVDVSVNKLFSADEIKTKSVEDIGRMLMTNLQYDDFEWLKQHPEIKYKTTHIAEGMENVLIYCPHCRAKYSLKTKKDTISCVECGYQTQVTNRYGFSDDIYTDFGQWYGADEDLINQDIRANDDYSLCSDVELKLPSLDGKKQMRAAGNGHCVLNKHGLTYNGTIDGIEQEKVFVLKSIYRLLFGAGENYEVYDGKTLYYFVPTEKRSCIEYYIASKCLYQKYVGGNDEN